MQTQAEKDEIKRQWEASGRALKLEWKWSNDSEDEWRWDDVSHKTTLDCFGVQSAEVRIKPEPKADATAPTHYQGTACRDAIKAMLSQEEYIGWLRGSALKYQWRYREKGGLEDLKKADVYLAWLKEETK